MTFPQRVANSLIAVALSKIRDLYVYPRLENIIDEKFPQVLFSQTRSHVFKSYFDRFYDRAYFFVVAKRFSITEL
jgi:hypothetical protein